MITAKTSRAARALLDWSQRELAAAGKVGLSTVINFEREHRETTVANIAAIERAFADAGIEFLNHGEPGVRLRRRTKRR